MRNYFTRRFIALTIILFIVALLAIFAEHFWIFELLTHLRWHCFLAGTLLSVFLFYLNKHGWAMLALGTAVSQIALTGGYQGIEAITCTIEKEGEELSILQFNIGSRNERAGTFHTWLEVHRPLPDIIILFEATKKIDKYIKYMEIGQWPFVLTEYRIDNYGIAVVSSIENASLTLESIGDPYLPSVVIKGTTDINRIPFTLVATHPPPPLTTELAGARNKQFKALASWLRQDSAPNKILIGDLNVSPWSPWFKQLLSDANLRNAQQGKGYAGTFPTYGLPSLLAIPIDHTLVSPRIEVVERTVGPGYSFGSDHRLVETRLRLSRCKRAI